MGTCAQTSPLAVSTIDCRYNTPYFLNIPRKRVWFRTRRSLSSKESSTGKPTLIKGSTVCFFVLLLFVLESASGRQLSHGRHLHNDTNAESGPIIPPTSQTDITALIKIKNALTRINELKWNEDTDPCGASGEGWERVACSCEPFNRTTFAEQFRHCDNYIPGEHESRVIYLDLASGGAENDKLNGVIPPEIGQLDRLRWLDLEDNNLEGKIPKSFRNLVHTRFLSLAQNQLIGTIPAYFANFTKLKTLHLHGNNFSGSINHKVWCPPEKEKSPEELEELTATVHDNPLLCGEMPHCLTSIVKNANDTQLYSEAYNRTVDKYGECDSTPPECDEEQNGCRVDVPCYWTQLDNVTFSFTNFTDKNSGISHYEFSIIRVVNATSNDTFVVGVNNTVIYTPVNVTTKENGIIKTVLHSVTFNGTNSEKGLAEGQKYRVRLTAINNGAPPSNASIESSEVLVDLSPPEISGLAHGYFASTTHFSNDKILVFSAMSSTGTRFSDKDIAKVSWSGIVEPHSELVRVEVFLQGDEEEADGTGIHNYTDLAHCTVDRFKETVNGSCSFQKPALKAGKSYRFRMVAANEVGLASEEVTVPFTVYAADNSFALGLDAERFLGIMGSVFICVMMGTVLFLYCYMHRIKSRKLFTAEGFLKDLVYALVDQKDIILDKQQRVQPNEDVAIVFTGANQMFSPLETLFTDVVNSTAHSSKNPGAFQKLMVAHNQIMTEALNEFCGYEVRQEGDSFIVAFPSAILAMNFALKAQENLLLTDWSRDIMLLPGCSLIKNADGSRALNGPRVRMGIHWAKRPGIECKRDERDDTSFTLCGAEFDFIKEISDKGNGGQILLTHQAWLEIYGNLARCRFPTICRLGFYKREHLPNEIPLYEVHMQLGRSTVSQFPPLRKIEQVSCGKTLCIVPFPKRAADGKLTFVAIKMVFYAKNQLPDYLSDILFNIIAARAQIFQGTVITNSQQRIGQTNIAFQDPIKAIHFTYVLQISLVLKKWPKEMVPYSGPQVAGPDNVQLFNGPRLAMAIHTTDDFTTRENSGRQPEHLSSRYVEGPGYEIVQQLVGGLDGGQVVMTEKVWRLTQNNLPVQYEVLNLGRHDICHVYPSQMLLLELSPKLLKERTFRPIRTAMQYDKGYYNAPSTENPMAIVFVQVQKPKCIVLGEQAKQNNSLSKKHEEELQVYSEVYNEALARYTEILRKILAICDGYECKECDRGMFHLAFEEFKNAVVFATQLLVAMRYYDWSAKLLEIDEFSVKRCPSTKQITWRGLEPNVGIAYGFAGSKQPSKTGRADYLGALPNLAARLMTMAHAGQVWLHMEPRFATNLIQWTQKETVGKLVLEHNEQYEQLNSGELSIELSLIGNLLIRGFREDKTIYQATSPSLDCQQVDNNNLERQKSHNAKNPSKNARSTWLSKTAHQFRNSYGRIMYSNVHGISNGRRARRWKKTRLDSIDRLMRPNREAVRLTNGFDRTHTSSHMNGCAFRTPPETRLQNIDQPSASTSTGVIRTENIV